MDISKVARVYPSGEVEYGAKLSSRSLRIRERGESSRWQEGEAVP